MLSHYQEGFLAELRTHGSARGGVTGAVAFHVRWCVEHPDRARFLFTERPPASDALKERNRAFFGAVRGWWRVHAHHGALPDDDLVTAFVLWLGPAQELCRLWLRGEIPDPGDGRVGRLGEAAWRSLGGGTDDR